MAQAWVGTIPGTRITVVRPSAAALDEVADSAVAWTIRLAGASLLAGLLLAMLTLLVVPRAVADVRRPFTPGQLEAIVVKEQARQAYQAHLASTSGFILSGPRTERFGALGSMLPDPRWTRQTGEPAAISFGPGPYSYSEDAEEDPYQDWTAQEEWEYKRDPINLFFGGIGSAWDIMWDLTNSPSYAGPWTADGLPDADGDGTWEQDPHRKGLCEPFVEVFSGPQGVYINGAWNEYDLDVVSRDTYSVGCIPTAGDRHQMHMRLYDGGAGGADAAEGYWSVGTAHWDNENHSGSKRYDDTRNKVVASFRDGAEDRWFVQDAWTFFIGSVAAGGCEHVEGETPDPYDPRDPPANACVDYPDGYAYYVQLAA